MYKKMIFRCKVYAKAIVNSLNRIVGLVLRNFEKDPCVIMYMEGGFSSQMLRYAKGKWFEEHGKKLKFDLQWFDYNGMDGAGLEKREWRLPDCFPGIELPTATDKEIKRYKKLYGTDVQGIVKKYQNREHEIPAPVYVSKFDMDYLVNFESCTKYFDWDELKNVLDEPAKKIAEDIKEHQRNKKVIGVHVRRGDMTVTGHYWKVLTEKYFEKAINLVATDDCIIYFFSNGFDFVKDQIIPNLKHEYVLVDNDNKDYEDIYLYSLCDIQIASQGSWGELSFCFNKNENKMLIFPDYEAKKDYDVNGNGIVKHICLERDMYIS